MATDELALAPADALTIDRNIAAELTRQGLVPAKELPRITHLSDDTVRRRRAKGDWRLPEILEIARECGVEVTRLLK